jgi:hypothetical protein
MRDWYKITPREFAAMDENEKREMSREILTEAFGPPENNDKQRIIEEILDFTYGKVETLDSGQARPAGASGPVDLG